MYLEGIDVDRNYTLAYRYFDNLTNPLFNTSYHVFGRGLVHYYGLGLEPNTTLGCSLIREASSMNMAIPVFASIFGSLLTRSYYDGLCYLKRRQFKSARDQFVRSAFMQFAPSIDMLLEMKRIGLGGKEDISADSFFGSVLLSRLKEHFISIPSVRRVTSSSP